MPKQQTVTPAPTEQPAIPAYNPVLSESQLRAITPINKTPEQALQESKQKRIHMGVGRYAPTSGGKSWQELNDELIAAKSTLGNVPFNKTPWSVAQTMIEKGKATPMDFLSVEDKHKEGQTLNTIKDNSGYSIALAEFPTYVLRAVLNSDQRLNVARTAAYAAYFAELSKVLTKLGKDYEQEEAFIQEYRIKQNTIASLERKAKSQREWEASLTEADWLAIEAVEQKSKKDQLIQEMSERLEIVTKRLKSLEEQGVRV